MCAEYLYQWILYKGYFWTGPDSKLLHRDMLEAMSVATIDVWWFVDEWADNE